MKTTLKLFDLVPVDQIQHQQFCPDSQMQQVEMLFVMVSFDYAAANETRSDLRRVVSMDFNYGQINSEKNLLDAELLVDCPSSTSTDQLLTLEQLPLLDGWD